MNKKLYEQAIFKLHKFVTPVKLMWRMMDSPFVEVLCHKAFFIILRKMKIYFIDT